MAVFAGLIAAAPAGAFIYWSGNWEHLPNSGPVSRAALDGSGVLEGWIPNAGKTCGVAVDASHVYWTNGAGHIGRARIDGSAPEYEFMTLSKPSFACGVAVDASYIYWALNEGTYVGRAHLDGTSPEYTWLHDPNNEPLCGVAVDATNVYFADYSAIFDAPLAGGAAVKLASANNPCGVAVSASTGQVYWAEQETGTIDRVPIGGGAPMAIVSGGHHPCGVAVDAGHLYWANAGVEGFEGGGWSIGRANLDGSSPNQGFIASGIYHPCGVAVDGLGSSAGSGGGSGGGSTEAGGTHTHHLTGTVTDGHGHGVVGLGLFAFSPQPLGAKVIVTGAGGHYDVPVGDGQWHVWNSFGPGGCFFLMVPTPGEVTDGNCNFVFNPPPGPPGSHLIGSPPPPAIYQVVNVPVAGATVKVTVLSKGARLSRRTASRVLGHVTKRNLKAGRTRLRIPLSAAARSYLGKHRVLHALVQITLEFPGAEPLSSTEPLTLKLKLAHRHR